MCSLILLLLSILWQPVLQKSLVQLVIEIVSKELKVLNTTIVVLNKLDVLLQSYVSLLRFDSLLLNDIVVSPLGRVVDPLVLGQEIGHLGVRLILLDRGVVLAYGVQGS